MARPGRKPILDLDEIEYKEQLFHELRKFLKQKLGEKRRYVLVLAYESNQHIKNAQGLSNSSNKEIPGGHTNFITNFNPSAPLILFKTILIGLMSSVQQLVREYELTSGIERAPSAVEPKPREENGR